jgi:hypothetical protein
LDARKEALYKEVISLPETSSDNYIHWFIKLVIDGVEKYFDYEDEKKYEEKLIFFIAHIYFLLEGYSYQFRKAKLYEKRTEYLARELEKFRK